MFNYRLDVILPHKIFTWTDFGMEYIPHITPVATPLTMTKLCHIKCDHPTCVSADGGHLSVLAR